MSDAPSPFSPEVREAVCGHMNTDHPEDNVLIARGLGGLPDARTVRCDDYDEDGARFTATDAAGTDTPFRIAWDRPVTERADLRFEFARMYHEACERLGIEPRTAEEH